MDSILNEWLQGCQTITEIAETIHIESVEDSNKSLALQRTGYENLPKRYITDKGWYRQYQYMLLLKSESEIDEQRLDNYNSLDEISNWLDNKNRLKDYPDLGSDKEVTQVSCANALSYEIGEDGAITTYYLQLYFDVKEIVNDSLSL